MKNYYGGNVMKKARLVALVLAMVMVVTALSACAALERTVTVYNGSEQIAQVIVKKNKKLLNFN